MTGHIPDRKRRAGPLGRVRLSPTLMRRVQGDPNVYRNANLLATNRRTAPGVPELDLRVGGSPAPTVDEQMTAIQETLNAYRTALIAGGLMEEAE